MAIHPVGMRLFKVKLKSARKPLDLAGHGYQVQENGYFRVWVRLTDEKTRDVFNAYPGCWEWVRDEGEIE